MHKTWWFGPPETASQRTLRSFTVLHCLDLNRGRKRWRDRHMEHFKDQKNHVWHWMIYNDLLIFKTSTDHSTSHELTKQWHPKRWRDWCEDKSTCSGPTATTGIHQSGHSCNQKIHKTNVLRSWGCRNVSVNWLSLTITIWIWKSAKSHSGS